VKSRQRTRIKGRMWRRKGGGGLIGKNKCFATADINLFYLSQIFEVSGDLTTQVL